MGDYPDAWKAGDIQATAKKVAQWTCEHCQMEFDINGKALSEVNADGKPVILTVHHIDGNPANCEWENLLVCCQRCHLHIQTSWYPGGYLPLSWDGPPLWLTSRGLEYKPNPQLPLFTPTE